MNKNPNRYLPLLITACVIVAGWLGWLAYYSTTFHIVNTSPKTRTLASVAPFMKINFSRVLAPNSVSMNSTGGIVDSYSTSGKTITVKLNTAMKAGSVYKITIVSVASADGKVMSNVALTLHPRNVDYADLPQDQKDAILQQQNKPGAHGINFSGVDTLVNEGISIQQAQAFKDDVQKFVSQNLKQKLRSVVVVSSSIQPAPPNQENEAIFGMDFTLDINHTTYTATLSYSGLEDIELVLHDTSGNQVYDSGAI